MSAHALNVASILGIAAGDSVFNEERKVAPAVDSRSVVLDVWRQIDGQLGIGPGNEIDALAVIEVPGVSEGRSDLADNVGARHLNEPGVGRDQRDCPWWLLGLCGGGAGGPPSRKKPPSEDGVEVVVGALWAYILAEQNKRETVRREDFFIVVTCEHEGLRRGAATAYWRREFPPSRDGVTYVEGDGGGCGAAEARGRLALANCFPPLRQNKVAKNGARSFIASIPLIAQ